MLDVKLVELTGSGRDLEVSKLPAVVGRSPDVDVHVSDALVSRRHCELYDLEGTLVVRDIGSRNGTFVNGQRISEAHLLPDAQLGIGLTRFKAIYERKKAKRFGGALVEASARWVHMRRQMNCEKGVNDASDQVTVGLGHQEDRPCSATITWKHLD